MPSKSAQIQHFVRTKSGLCIVFGTALLALASILPGAIESLVVAVAGGLLLLTGLSLRLEHLEARSAATEQRLGLEQNRRRSRESEDAARTTDRDERLATHEVMIHESAKHVQELQPLPAIVAALEQATDTLARTKTSSEAFAALSSKFERATDNLARTKTSSDAFAVLSSKFSAQVDALAGATAAIGELQNRAVGMGERLAGLDEARSDSLARLIALERATKVEFDALRSQPHVAEALVRVGASAERILNRPHSPSRELHTVDLNRTLTDARPAVSVVVTCFDHELFIGECLESVRNQTFANFECIIVDDASTDQSVLRAEEAVALDDRFTIVKHPENKGPSAARNTGLRHATAPFICFLDSDDLFLRTNLEHRLDTLLAVTSHSVAGVFSGIEPAPADVLLTELPDAIAWEPPGPKNFLSTRGENPFNLHAPLLRTDVMRSTGGFDESLRSGAEDWELWLRLMRNGFEFIPCPHKLAIYRQKSSTAAWRAAPSGFRQVSTELLQGVNEAADPSWRVANSPFFFEEPLASYETRLSVAKRDFIFLGLSALADDHEELNHALEAIPTDLPRPLVDDELADHLYAGLRRGLGLAPEESQAIRPELESLRDLLFEHARPTPTRPVANLGARPNRNTSDPVQLFWWKTAVGSPGHGNFGDELSPLLVSLVSGREVEWADKHECELVGLGSILDLVLAAEHRSPAIWGSGFIRDGNSTGAGLHISSVRGHASSVRCGSIGGVGDPALLARYFDVVPTGPHRVGLIPHYVDWDLPIATSFEDQVAGSVLINPLSPPMDVVNAIAGCDFVFSSSLHGLIVADSLGVPNAWIELSENVVGDGYKFGDYYSCFDIESPQATRPTSPADLDELISDLTEEYERPGLDALITGVVDSFPTHL